MTRSKKLYATPIVCAAFMLAMSAVCDNPTVEARDNIGHRAHEKQKLRATNAHGIISYVMYKFEGSGFVPNDCGRGPSKYGILGRDNGLSYQQVKHLSPERAISIYKHNYWNAIEADKLPPAMRLVAFNAAVQFGPKRANAMIEQADGNPYALHRATSNFYQRLIRKHPSKFKRYSKVWQKRQAIIARHIGHGVPQNMFPAFVSYERDNATKASAIPSSPQTPQNYFADQPSPSGLGFKAVTLFAFLAGSLAYLNRRRKKAAEKFTATAVSLTSPLRDKLRTISPSPLPDYQPAYPYGLAGLSDKERMAFRNVFSRRDHRSLENGNKWRVDYYRSHVTVEKGQVTMHGNDGIEDSILYAAQAWGSKCKITGGSKEELEKIKAAAQNLVDKGAIASGFTLEGLGTFHRAPLPRRILQWRPIFAAPVPA